MALTTTKQLLYVKLHKFIVHTIFVKYVLGYYDTNPFLLWHSQLNFYIKLILFIEEGEWSYPFGET